MEQEIQGNSTTIEAPYRAINDKPIELEKKKSVDENDREEYLESSQRGGFD